jgi:predicted ATPase
LVEVLWCLGYPDQALKKGEEALVLARAVAHPLTLWWGLNSATRIHLIRREGPLCEERAEAMIAFSTEQGTASFEPYGTIFRGWARIEQGKLEDGIVDLRQGLARMSDLALATGRSTALSLLAAACGKLGQTDDALALMAEAFAQVESREERVWEAEIYRLKGELLLDSKQSAEAESCFRHAIVIARRQSAKSLELRAVMSLSRLLQRSGKRDEARQMLAEIYAWFTEGFDTADLKDAKALLEELST